MKVGLDRKIIGGFVICCLVLILAAVITIRNSQEFLDASAWVNHTHEVLYECEQILMNMEEAETGARGYVITGNNDFLQTYNTARAAIPQHLQKVTLLTRDNAEQQANMERLSGLAERHQEQQAVCIELKRQKASVEAISVSLLENRKTLVEIRTLIGSMREIEATLLVERKNKSDEDAGNFLIFFSVLLGVMLLALIAVYIIITTAISKLRKLEKETSGKNWILAGAADVMRGMQGEKTIPDLGQEVLRRLTAYLDMPLATFYVTQRDNRTLRLKASFALPSTVYDTMVPFGEGFVGEVASGRKMAVLNGLHAENYSIGTTFGAVRPQYILAFPFMFENTVTGIIEMGSLREFSEQQKLFLQHVADSIAIAVMSASSRELLTELLEETQRQGEELETQQEELRQFNEELHTKTEMLERSEVELKAQQAELEMTNVDLEEKSSILSQQKEELEYSKMEIEKKAREVELSSRYKSEFLSNMSHELRTPLNSILILAQLLSENRNNNLAVKEVDFARNIHTSGTGLLNLINEILDLSKIEAGKMELDILSFTVSDLVQSVKQMVEGIASSRSIALVLQMNEDVAQLSITSDRQRVEQIMRNLLSNALKFTPVHGTVTLAVETPDLARGSQGQKDVVMFSVTDTGIGIPEDKRELIFQAFQQADGSTKRQYGGTGLGLSISRELANALGGEIRLTSREGEGSTFMLFLPVEFDHSSKGVLSEHYAVKEKKALVNNAPTINYNPSQEETSKVEDDRNTIQDQDKIVLIIEDDEKFAQILLNFIRERGYKGVIAGQGNTGLSYARHYKPIAILLDMNLPVMDGHEVMRLVKNDPELRHIPVQIISAYDKRKESMSLGAFDYLNKPVSVEDLRKAFDRITAFTNSNLKKLLIVEDDYQQNKAIRELIGSTDIKSVSAHSGEEAYQLLEKEPFDCMILDLGLPQMSGFDLMEKIRANEKLSRVPIIVYTGRDLKREDTARLTKLADTVVLKTANSQERLLDETILFLHRVESELPKDKQSIIRKLHNTDEILRNKKILLVDDDIRNIYSLTNALEEENIFCFTAENGRSAIETLKQNPDIDLILMDVMMPEMDGYEATLEIRKMAPFKKLPIIALTAKAMKGDKEKCLAVGMSDYISKPVQVTQLLSLMRVWLYK